MAKTGIVERIELKSDVCRDLLQSAGQFQNPKRVLWEYVANGLQYHDAGIKPEVRVKIGNGKIIIADNGSGMDFTDLQHFFTMHAENRERKKGKAGRGRFGTGKSAAFAIARTLRIDTRRDGKRNVVELRREDIDSNIGKDTVPITPLVSNEPTKLPNGTEVFIEDLIPAFRSKLEVKGIIEFIQQKPLIHRPNVVVTINEQKCEYTEPEACRVETFTPSREFKELLGNITLTVKVAFSPLERSLQGVKIISSDEVHETTLGTCEGKEMADRIFGEVEVPALDEEQQPPAIDVSRNGKLNPDNPVVQALDAFISQSVDNVRLQLVKEKKEHQKTEEAKRFRELERQITSIINEHFNEFRSDLRRTGAQAEGGMDTLDNDSAEKGEDQSVLMPGGVIPAKLTEIPIIPGTPNPDPPPPPPVPDPRVEIVEDKDNPNPEITASATGGENKKRPRGGFSVDHENAGVKSPRTRSEPEKRIIWVNLDHPQMSVALTGRDINDPIFKRLFFEVALTEYIVLLMYEKIYAGELWDVKDVLTDFRHEISRITASAAFLYE